MMFISEALLYADADTPQFILLPILVFLFLPKLLFSYLEITSNGIRAHYWPNFSYRAEWQEIERLGKATFLGKAKCDALYLITPRGETFSDSMSRQQGIQTQSLIALSDFKGWPKGRLYQDLFRRISEVLEHAAES